MKDVLICCTDAEGSQLEWLAKALFDTGWSVNFMHKGSSGVASANCVIAVWSPKSVGDAWLMARAKTAAKRRRLVSVRLGGARPPRGLRSEQVIDLSDWPARGADRAINTLLGSVDAVANGAAQRAADDDGSKLWIALVVCAVLVGGGYALFRLTEAPSGVSSNSSRDPYESVRAADAAAAAEHAMRSAAKTAESAKAAEGERVVDTDVVAAKPAAVTSDAARIGAQSLSQLTAAIDGGTIRIEDVRRAAEEALALDPQEPHARAVLATLRGLVDLQWADARRYAKDLDAGSSDGELARIVASLHALFGNASAADASSRSANPAGAAERTPDPRCDIADDAAFAQAIIDLDGARRITLLDHGCVVERIQRSAVVRAQLGIVPG